MFTISQICVGLLVPNKATITSSLLRYFKKQLKLHLQPSTFLPGPHFRHKVDWIQ